MSNINCCFVPCLPFFALPLPCILFCFVFSCGLFFSFFFVLFFFPFVFGRAGVACLVVGNVGWGICFALRSCGNVYSYIWSMGYGLTCDV